MEPRRVEPRRVEPQTVWNRSDGGTGGRALREARERALPFAKTSGASTSERKPSPTASGTIVVRNHSRVKPQSVWNRRLVRPRCTYANLAEAINRGRTAQEHGGERGGTGARWPGSRRAEGGEATVPWGEKGNHVG